MQTVVEAPLFTRQAEKLFSESEKHELIDFLATNPLSGDVIPETGGARVVYYFLDETMPLYALLVDAKSARTVMAPNERKAVAALAAELKAAGRRDRE